MYFINALAFLMAFCSVSYQLIIASKLSRLLGEGMFVYPLCIALFILAMGIGVSFHAQYSKDKISQALKKLCQIEFILSLLGSISILSINLTLFDSLYLLRLEAVVVGLMMICVIGFYSGQEIPLLLQYCSTLNVRQKQFRRIIFFDYLASLFASLLCALFFFAHIGFLKTSIIISLLNLGICIGLIIFTYYKRKFIVNISIISLFIVIILMPLFGAKYLDKTENTILTRALMGDRHVRLIKKFHTPYQQVLLFIQRKDLAVIQRSNKEILANPDDYYIFVTLNGSLQFFEPLGIKADPDHTFFFEPYIHLLPKVENVLILGGGDGLPSRIAAQYPEIKQMTMVDLDERWVQFSRTDPFMKFQNKRALDDPRLNIIFKDAFKWVESASEKFDLIIIDFPSESRSLGAKRTRSVQFLRGLSRILNEDGLIIDHSHGGSSRLALSLDVQSAQSANLTPLIAISEKSTTWTRIEQMVLFKSKQKRQHFLNKYKEFYLRDKKFEDIRTNIGVLDYKIIKAHAQAVSFYDPFVSGLSLKEKWELLRGEF